MLSARPVLSSASWMSWGACRGEDPEMFFPIAAGGPALDQINAAKAVCRRCAVLQPCLSYAAATMQDGIWGGTTRDERRLLRGRPALHDRQAADMQAGRRNARGAGQTRGNATSCQAAASAANGLTR